MIVTTPGLACARARIGNGRARIANDPSATGGQGGTHEDIHSAVAAGERGRPADPPDAEYRHDMDATLATLHPECVFVDQLLDLRLTGRDGARRPYRMWWSAFGNTVEGGELHWVRDDLVIGEARFAGRHVGKFAGIPPTGEPISLPLVVFVKFRDGLLAAERFVSDLNGLLRQLGRPSFEVGRA
jgi:predicted ester cyclase